MGTRGLVCFKYKGKYYCIYNHWDSYFEGLGLDLVNEIKAAIKDGTFDEWKNMLEKCKIIDENENPTYDDIEKLKDVTDLKVSSQSTSDWYCLLRNTHGSFIKPLEVGYLKLHNLNLNTLSPCDLFIEYTYLLNLDVNTFTPCAYGKSHDFNALDIPDDWMSYLKEGDGN